jgi:hypothetical protein
MGHPFIFGSYAPTSVASVSTAWARPVDWIAIPTLSALDERFCGVYAVYENAYNRLAITATNLAANIDYGDGTSVVSNGSQQLKVYDYAALSGTVYQDAQGFDYKMVLVDITRVGGAITSLSFTVSSAINYLSAVNFLDINCSLPSATTLNLSTSIGASGHGMGLVQRVRVWDRPAAHSVSQFTLGMHSLRVFEYPYNKALSLANVLNGTTGSIDNTGNIANTGTSLGQSFLNARIKKIGNITANSVTTALNMAYLADSLQEVGDISLNSATTIESIFNGCLSLVKVGTIAIPICTTLTQAFNQCSNLREVAFIDCAAVTTTTSMYASCTMLYACHMPNLTRGVSFVGTAMGNYGMDIFANGNGVLNGVGTAAGLQNITVTGTPFGASLTALNATSVAIALVLTTAGFTIVN